MLTLIAMSTAPCLGQTASAPTPPTPELVPIDRPSADEFRWRARALRRHRTARVGAFVALAGVGLGIGGTVAYNAEEGAGPFLVARGGYGAALVGTSIYSIGSLSAATAIQQAGGDVRNTAGVVSVAGLVGSTTGGLAPLGLPVSVIGAAVQSRSNGRWLREHDVVLQPMLQGGTRGVRITTRF